MVKLVRDRKDNVSVRDIQHVFFNLLSPSDCVAPGTGGTEPVFTVVVYFSYLSAIWASINIYSKSCGSARSDSLDCFILFRLDKMFWFKSVNVPPLVEKSSKAKLFLTKPVMFFLCMNSTFTHVARVFERTSSTTHGSGPVANTNLQVKSELAIKK